MISQKLIKLFYHTTELGDLTDDIFISAFDIFDIGDDGIPACDHTREDHRDSGSEVP
jgi:hypothetical protein